MQATCMRPDILTYIRTYTRTYPSIYTYLDANNCMQIYALVFSVAIAVTVTVIIVIAAVVVCARLQLLSFLSEIKLAKTRRWLSGSQWYICFDV